MAPIQKLRNMNNSVLTVSYLNIPGCIGNRYLFEAHEYHTHNIYLKIYVTEQC